MTKEQFALLELNRDRTLCIYVPSLLKGKFITFDEGMCDVLDEDDYEEGFEGYINYTQYDLEFDGELELAEHDGGAILIEKPYREMSMKEIVQAILDMVADPSASLKAETENITVIDFEDLTI